MANQIINFDGVEILSNPKDNPNPRYRLRNFSGVPNGNFESTERFFNIRVPDEQVDEVLRAGVETWSPSPDETGYAPTFARVSLGVNKDNPNLLNAEVYLVSKGRRVQLDAETIKNVDKMWLTSENKLSVGVGQKKNRPGEYKLWANVLYLYQNVKADPWASQFAETEEQ